LDPSCLWTCYCQSISLTSFILWKYKLFFRPPNLSVADYSFIFALIAIASWSVIVYFPHSLLWNNFLNAHSSTNFIRIFWELVWFHRQNYSKSESQHVPSWSFFYVIVPLMPIFLFTFLWWWSADLCFDFWWTQIFN